MLVAIAIGKTAQIPKADSLVISAALLMLGVGETAALAVFPLVAGSRGGSEKLSLQMAAAAFAYKLLDGDYAPWFWGLAVNLKLFVPLAIVLVSLPSHRSHGWSALATGVVFAIVV